MEKNITLQQNDIRVFNAKSVQPKQLLSAIKVQPKQLLNTIKVQPKQLLNTIKVQPKQLLSAIKKAATNPIEWLRQYYSSVLEREVSMGQTLRYVHAQMAFFMGVFLTYDSLLVHAAVGVWALWAILRCRE